MLRYSHVVLRAEWQDAPELVHALTLISERVIPMDSPRAFVSNDAVSHKRVAAQHIAYLRRNRTTHHHEFPLFALDSMMSAVRLWPSPFKYTFKYASRFPSSVAA